MTAVSFVLFIVGVLVRYAVSYHVAWAELPYVGDVLMASGGFGVVCGLIAFGVRHLYAGPRLHTGAADAYDGPWETSWPL